MIIRSQDKKSIIADLNLNIRHEESWADDFWDIETSTGKLVGTYSTEEKAIKVLDMICEHAEALHFSKVAPNECGQIWGNVFNMPQDSEV